MTGVSLLGYIFIPLGIILLMYPTKYLIMTTIFSSIFQAASVFTVNGNSINPLLFFCMMLILKDIANNILGESKKVVTPIWAEIFLLLICYNIIITKLAPLFFGDFEVVTDSYWYVYGGTNVTTKLSIIGERTTLSNMITLVVYIVAITIIYKYRNTISHNEFRKLISIILFAVLSIGAISMLSLNFGIGNDFFKNTIYSDTESEALEAIFRYERNLGFRFVSTFKEGSYCGGFLASFLLATIVAEYKNSKWMLLSILIAILLNQSSTGLVITGIGVVLIILFSKKRSLKVYVPVIALCIITAVIAIFYEDIFTSLIFNKFSSSSGLQRNAKNKNCWDAMCYSLGLGIGLGNIRGSSLIFNLLGSVGLPGTLLFCEFIYKVLKGHQRSIRDYNKNKNRLFAEVFAAFCFLAQILSQPDLFLNTFWMAIMFLVITDKHTTKTIKKEKFPTYTRNMESGSTY